MDEKKLYIKEVKPGIFLMDEAHEATGYLVIGEKKACMIDTMNGYNNLNETARKLTDKPVVVVNTHGHPDHIFGNVFFSEAYMNPADLDLARSFVESPEYRKILKEQNLSFPPFRNILPGDVIDLGGRTLEVFSLPGHTPGSILLLLKEDRILFTGDAVNHHLWMQLDGCLSISDYVKELVDKNFRDFIETYLSQYDIERYPVGVVGGFGYANRTILEKVAAECGVKISTIISAPMERLVNYHMGIL